MDFSPVYGAIVHRQVAGTGRRSSVGCYYYLFLYVTLMAWTVGGEIGRCAFADHSFRAVPSFLVEYSFLIYKAIMVGGECASCFSAVYPVLSDVSDNSNDGFADGFQKQSLPVGTRRLGGLHPAWR